MTTRRSVLLVDPTGRRVLATRYPVTLPTQLARYSEECGHQPDTHYHISQHDAGDGLPWLCGDCVLDSCEVR